MVSQSLTRVRTDERLRVVDGCDDLHEWTSPVGVPYASACPRRLCRKSYKRTVDEFVTR